LGYFRGFHAKYSWSVIEELTRASLAEFVLLVTS
jgi:hypothetical protein